MLTKAMAFAFCILFVSAGSPRAPTPPAANEKSCFEFTQSFYNWYVKILLKTEDRKDAPDLLFRALNYKGHHFSSELTLAFRQARAEEAKYGDAVIDSDPFLNTQDPTNRYFVRSVTKKHGHYFADVYGIYPVAPPDLSKGPDVVAELVFKDGSWIFVNFHYPHTGPGADDLLSLLNYQDPGTQPNEKHLPRH